MSTMVSNVEAVYRELDTQGVVRLDGLIPAPQLAEMQRAFESKLGQLRWNTVDGFEKTEPYRHMISDVLTLEQGFVDVALHPLVKEVLAMYLGDSFILAEAKGWKSLATSKDFHCWHGDAWYCQETLDYIPREVKLAYYLTDVTSGAFQYLRGTHRQHHPREYANYEINAETLTRLAEFKGPAGTAFLFDTSGIHRQAVPILEPRNAVFLNYHDPTVPIQAESVRSYRYHPLLLNAAFLGGLTAEDERILGFGEKSRFQPCYRSTTRYERTRRLCERFHSCNLILDDFTTRASRKLRRLIKR